METSDRDPAVSAAEVEFSAELERLRKAKKLSQRELGVRTAYTRAYVSIAEKPGGIISKSAVEAIDGTLSAGGRLVDLHSRAVEARKARRRGLRHSYSARTAQRAPAQGAGKPAGPSNSPMTLQGVAAQNAAIDHLLAEVTGSETTTRAIDHFESATTYLAEYHSQAAPRAVLSEIARVHDELCGLKSKRKRLSQAREVYRIESNLLSQACIIYGDLKLHITAEKVGDAALSLAIESGSNQAVPRSALAKTLRWSGRLVESAVMARTGYDSSPRTPIRIQLASQEANAAALLGDKQRAYEALGRAERSAAVCASDSGRSAWSFSGGRQAIFRLAVATSSGDATGALDAVAMADDAWESGSPCLLANWAQIRAGAGIAHLLRGSLDGMKHEVTPILSIPADRRVSTVTAYTSDLARRIDDSKSRKDKIAVEVQELLHDFNHDTCCP